MKKAPFAGVDNRIDPRQKSIIDTDDYFYTFNVDNFRSYTLFYFDFERKTAFELRAKT
mgnify:FL=1